MGLAKHYGDGCRLVTKPPDEASLAGLEVLEVLLEGNCNEYAVVAVAEKNPLGVYSERQLQRCVGRSSAPS
jgi:hypothetical protein